MADHELPLSELPLPLDLESLIPGRRGWEVEVGFGKGAYLLRRAAAESESSAFLGIEIVSKYYRLVRDRARKRGCRNTVLLRAEALYLLSTVLPRRFARAVHVYHPDPWPKSRHNKRRLFDVESVDLILGLLAPGGKLYFATDHAGYGEVVADVLESHAGLAVERLEGDWPDGPRTHYEARYVAAGTPILRLEVQRLPGGPLVHPAGLDGLVAATSTRSGG